MADDIRQALARGGLIEMTTTGRLTGRPRRIEIAIHDVGGRLYISGMPSPRKRSWLANLEADPRLTVHLKGALPADAPATARVVVDEAERRAILQPIALGWRRDLDEMVVGSPLIEVTLDSAAESSVA